LDRDSASATVPAIRAQRLQLEHFRAYRDLDLTLPAAGLRVSGPNGAGKSTLLDALLLVSTTRSRRGMLDGDLIGHESGVEFGVAPYARVVSSIDRAGTAVRIEVFVQRSERRTATKKLLRVADRPRRASDVVGLFPTVSFAPDDLELVLGPPSQRRRFLDILLSQTDRQYLRCLSRYAKILAQRNSLLRQANDHPQSTLHDQLAFWDEQLVALGAYLIAARVQAVAALANAARSRFGALASDVGEIEVGYLATVHGTDEWWAGLASPPVTVTTAAQQIGAAFEHQLRRGRQLDIARGMTLVGPHRDDIVISADGRELARFGSRGQQRLAVVALKLAEIDVATNALGARPALLLDDVLSELDLDHRESLLREIAASAGQAIVTATDHALLDRPELAALGQLEVREGAVVSSE
jgi:DNA replication and repair protein RecF